MTVHSSELFAQAYNAAFRAIMAHDKERFTFTGGRASGKSSFISIALILLIVTHSEYNALVIRKTARTLRRSVFEQIIWAIQTLKLQDRFRIPQSTTAALPIIYRRADGTTQQIIFAGCDDADKIKSLKTAHGYFAILWAEEKTEFSPQELQNIRISALRGGKQFYIFESFNPPASIRHWCNAEAITRDEHRIVVHTTYQDMPEHWLGDAILHDIAQIKHTNFRAYENIYLGKATGTGRTVFENVELEEITEDEIAAFDYCYNGIDWGYYPDPFAFVRMCFDSKHQTLYIFDELYLYKHGNYEAYRALQEHLETQGLSLGEERITADSAEPKSIADFRAWGADVRGAIKGVGSLDAGFRWLQQLACIVIDPARCPRAADEFSLYEYDLDKKTGEILSGYPQGQPDHAMAAVRYALERIWRRAGE